MSDVCRRILVSLGREGFTALIRLMRQLVEAGFVSKERAVGAGSPNVYRLNLPQRQPQGWT
jgi:hypothetical protein